MNSYFKGFKKELCISRTHVSADYARETPRKAFG